MLANLARAFGASLVVGLVAIGCQMTGADPPNGTSDPKPGNDGGSPVGEPFGHLLPGVIACGGLAGRPCPRGLVCVDDPSDSCDPAAGGADCGGICIAHPKVPPSSDDQRCQRSGRRYVSSDPGACSTLRYACAEGSPFSDECGCGCEASSSACGPNTCGAGEFCCNASCGICAPIGGYCTEQFCAESGTTCGSRTCPPGTVGCNCACKNAECIPEGTACADVCL